METLLAQHNFTLVIMACLVATVAAFTGLSLTRELAKKPVLQRKISISLAAIALGGGIWSMHFVAMLGLQLPILFYYDAALTLVSALTAILIVGVALVLLHFVERTPLVISSAGGIVGIGVLAMHYIGMAGLQQCRAIYTPFGLIVSSVVAIGLCVLAIWLAYGKRRIRNIYLGSLCFAVAVCSVHFLAMAGTSFVAVPSLAEFGLTMSNEVLAIGVIFSSFVLFGTFLWVGVTFLVPQDRVIEPQIQTPAPRPKAAPHDLQIPCERDGIKVFIAPEDVILMRADGHYTQVYTDRDRLFCVWPITQASKRLVPVGFLQTHRSYLVNSNKVLRFERAKDKGRCVFQKPDLPPAPVSRSKLKSIQDVLCPERGAIGAE
ncbi:MHYT domain-containing protein [Tritonibacter horizontis]|uniref:CO-responsive transcriptional regulator RcoM n=1 Tax=Tritonibacter horizontis TaxID=1768241 RepID=A0A132C2G4_9RHOB|nr:MHYT domain-containing protein [Tritonibacter horizontis]KUP94845.1 CO-responsive transcriptional regulator RcoM [Tritonibacter horizontis]